MTIKHNGNAKPVVMALRGECLCQWFEGTKFRREIFPTAGLVLVQKETD